jgi:tRNA threonylcarbamoyladenosine biosynthesis protein TsaB
VSDHLHARLCELSDRLGGPLLALDTSSASAALCLVSWRAGEVRELSLDAAAVPSESLGRVLAREIATAALDLRRLSGIVVGLGPGSFTGLRVGLATAKGLSLGAGVPLFGTSSLAMLAASSGPGRVAPIIEARRGEVFVAVYDVADDGRVVAVVYDRATTPAGGLALVREYGSDVSVRLVGNGVPAVAALGAPSGVALAPSAELRAGFGILHVAHRLASRDADPTGSLAPRYLKLSEAERGRLT